MQTQKISYKRHRFPPQIIAHIVWLYVRFNLSLREVEELMLERGVDVSYETIRRWSVKFGPLIAHVLQRRQPRPGDVWHLDEVVVKIAGRSYWLWRAVDGSGQNMGVVVGDLACAKVSSLYGGLPWTYGLQSKLPSTTGRSALISLTAFLDHTG